MNLNQEITKLNSDYLQKMSESYIIQTEIEDESLPNTQILEMEPAVTSLDEIIKYRRENKAPWSVKEFEHLLHDCIQGLYTLHSNKIAHNDIRPCNIFYSLKRQTYMIGSFANAIKLRVPESNKSISHEMHSSVLKVRSSKAFEAPEIGQSEDFDPLKSDVYSLGMSMLSAFYLVKPISRKGTAPYNRKFESTYKVMKYIRQMVKPEAKDRASFEFFHDVLSTKYNPEEFHKNPSEKMSNLI